MICHEMPFITPQEFIVPSKQLAILRHKDILKECNGMELKNTSEYSFDG